MNLADLTARVILEVPDAPIDRMEQTEGYARRALAEELSLAFWKEVSLTLDSNGQAYVYRLSPSTNPDLIWKEFARAVHSDETEISILPLSCTPRDLKYPRSISDYYWGCLESKAAGQDVILTVYESDGETPVDGEMTMDFLAIPTLANWPTVHDAALVMKCVALLAMPVKKN